MEQSFIIQLDNSKYHIKRCYESDYSLYEVYTQCKKLFTLKRGADGKWKTEERDVIAINDHLIDDIGTGIENYELV